MEVSYGRTDAIYKTWLVMKEGERLWVRPVKPASLAARLPSPLPWLDRAARGARSYSHGIFPHLIPLIILLPNSVRVSPGTCCSLQSGGGNLEGISSAPRFWWQGQSVKAVPVSAGEKDLGIHSVSLLLYSCPKNKEKKAYCVSFHPASFPLLPLALLSVHVTQQMFSIG